MENTIMRNCIVISNTAAIAGGGIYCAKNVLVDNTSILDNGASAGAGLYIDESTTIRNCLIVRNIAGTRGGGIYIITDDQKRGQFHKLIF